MQLLQTCSPGCKYTKNTFAEELGRKRIFGVLREPKYLARWLQMLSYIVKGNLKIEANVVVSEQTVCYRVVV